jgi:hypothetical protein
VAAQRPGEGQCLANSLQHALPIPHHLVIPHAQNPPSLRFQKTITPNIGLAIRMLSAVKLDHEAMFDRSEIGNKRPDRHLPAKISRRRNGDREAIAT